MTAPTLSNSPLPSLSARIEDGIVTATAGKRMFVEGTLAVAQSLADARDYLEDDRSFGRWVDAIPKLAALNHNDRAALINMGRFPDLAAQALEITTRSSWRLIWEEMKAFVPTGQAHRRRRFPSAGKPRAPQDEERETAKHYMRETATKIAQIIAAPLAEKYLPLVDPGERRKVAKQLLAWLQVETGWLLQEGETLNPFTQVAAAAPEASDAHPRDVYWRSRLRPRYWPIATNATPAVPVKRSINRKARVLVCLGCGQHLTSLAMHLQRIHRMTPEQYRQRFGLSDSYPMSYRSRRRSEATKQTTPAAPEETPP